MVRRLSPFLDREGEALKGSRITSALPTNRSEASKPHEPRDSTPIVRCNEFLWMRGYPQLARLRCPQGSLDRRAENAVTPNYCGANCRWLDANARGCLPLRGYARRARPQPCRQ